MDALQIFDEWRTYEKVVAGDYMHHRRFFAALIYEVEARIGRSRAVIDIGCGDAGPVLELMRRLQTRRYVGIDQSQVALELANKSLISLNISYELRSGSMLDELSSQDERFDLAIASYSLHHLDRTGKQAALSECRRILRPGAMLAIVDVFLEEGESRSTYFERWGENARRKFTALAPAELEALLDHVQRCDIPETVSTYCELGKSVGFNTVDPIREDHEQLNKLVIFQ